MSFWWLELQLKIIYFAKKKYFPQKQEGFKCLFPQKKHHKTGIFGTKTLFSALSDHILYLVHSYPIFGEFLTLFKAETPFLSLAGENSLGQSGGPSRKAPPNFAAF